MQKLVVGGSVLTGCTDSLVVRVQAYPGFEEQKILDALESPALHASRLCLIKASREKTNTAKFAYAYCLTHCFLSIGVVLPVPLLLSRR